MSSAKGAGLAERKRRRASTSIDLSQSPPLTPPSSSSNAAAASSSNGAALGRAMSDDGEGEGDRDDEEEDEADNNGGVPAPIVFKRELPPRQAAVLASAIAVAEASPIKPSGPPRPSRAAKSEASARLQAISVSLADNGEVSRTIQERSEARGRQAKKARLQAEASSSARAARIVIDDDDEEGGEEEEGEEEGEEEEEEDLTQQQQPRDTKQQSRTAHKSSRKSSGAGDTKAASSSSAGTKSSGRATAAASAPAPRSSSSSRARASSSHAAAASSSSSSSAAAAAAASSSSASSSSAAAAAAARTKSKPRDNRRDKRVSGFGAWKTVHKAHIPAVTYEGYEDLATETLEPETHLAIRKSKGYEPQGLDAYNRSPWDIIYGAAEMPLTLFRRVDTKYGRDEYKVKAQRNIDAKEVVAFLGGRLMEQVKSSKQNVDEWNQNFQMPKEWLKEFFEYPGDHSLVVSTKDHRSLSKYIRAPEERMDEGEGPNVKTDVVLDPKGGLFFVIYYALEPIRRGAELFCQPFLGEWHTRCHREMFLYSRVSHWYHRWALLLEQALSDAGVSWDTRKPPNIPAKLLTPEQEEKFLNIPGMDQGVLPAPLPLEQSMKIMDIDEAMEYCGCVHAPQAHLQDISKETQHYIDAVGNFIPDYIDIKNPPPVPSSLAMAAAAAGEDGEGIDEAERKAMEIDGEEAAAAAASSSSSAAAAAASSSSAAAAAAFSNPAIVHVVGEMSRVRVDKAAVAELISKGMRDDLVELREDFGINSPVRHFTPPNYRAFCVVATNPIPKGTFVFCYAGVITEDVVNRDSAYVYTMERDQIRRTVRSYHGPDLYLDAMKVGNISRFVNDNTYRVGEDQSKGCTANLETQFLFHKASESAPGTIHLGFYTTRDVRPGEELVSQYGEEYWKTINKQLIAEHKKFFDYVNPYTRKLERIAFNKGVALPPHPADLWSVPGEDLFVPKLKPYPPLTDPVDASTEEEDPLRADGVEEAFEVERILNSRKGDDGQIWYKVKWKHHSTAHNEWIPSRNVVDCHDLVAEFHASEATKSRHKSTKNNSSSHQKKKK